jgi:transposase
MTDALYVGIDVAKDSFVVASDPASLKLTLPNNPTGWQALGDPLKPQAVALIVLEATGGYERGLVAALLEQGHRVVVANPRQVRDFARGIGTLGKTDRLDAAVIARFARVVQPQPRPQTEAQIAELAELVLRRRQLSDLLTQESNRLGRAAHPEVRKSLRRSIDALDKQIARLDKLIRQHIDSDGDLRRKDQIVQSVKGIGAATSAMLLARLPELGRLNRQAITSLVGLAPWDRQSGQWTGQAHIWGGRAEVRSALYMAALVASRFNPVIRAFYQRLLAAGKAPKVALTACMRKLLIILNTLVRRDCLWSPKLEPSP